MQSTSIKSLITKTGLKPLIFFGPSGSGKSTLASHLITKHPGHFDLSVSCTTRPIRQNEQHARSYYFISQAEFRQKREKSEFLEFMEYNGNFYGTPISELSRIISDSKVPVLDIDYNGVKKMIELFGEENSIRVFVNVTDADILKQRLKSRKSETEESLNQRLAITLEELKYLSEHKLYTHMVNNDNLDLAKLDVDHLITSQYKLNNSTNTSNK